MSASPQHQYTVERAQEDLGVLPDYDEALRLVKYYPTYQLKHRIHLVEAIRCGKNNKDLVLAKLQAKGIDPSVSKQQKGGHARWVSAKLRKTVIRFLYLRYRLDEGLTKVEANRKLLKKFGKSETAKDGGQSSIRKATRSPVLDH